MGNTETGIYLLGVDAKDLYLSNQFAPSQGYQITNPNGSIRLHKFLHKLDNCLELIKLREIYFKVHRRRDFSFWENGKEFTTNVIHVTFHYSCKEFNQYANGCYIKFGYSPREITLHDSVFIMNNQLIAIQTGVPIQNPVDPALLGKWFVYQDGVYQLANCGKTLQSVSDLRKNLYQNGFYCNGIHYVRYKRSSGSSRVGKCLFIEESLYSKMHKWELCGLKMKPGEQLDLAALESYMALTLSSIIDTIQIDPASILVIEDYESVFEDQVIRIECGNKEISAIAGRAKISNNIWDGQSLIDCTIMGAYRQFGFLLLRNRFFKSACFQCNIQQWFRDHGITKISQLNGFTLADKVEQIRLITTPSSIKYLKFGKLKDWLQKIDPVFGVVKHEKATPFFDGRLVQLHYQLLNTLPLQEKEIIQLVSPSLDYLRQIKKDPCVLKFQIHYNNLQEDQNIIQNKNDLIYRMLGVNSLFYQTKLYRQFKTDLIKSMVKNMRKGHLLVPGNYSTLLGNPIEMLQQSIGCFCGASQLGVGKIHTHRFLYGQQILGVRSPHITMGNIWLPVNQENTEIDRYFLITEEIVCINSIGENTLQRLSGCDFDSDTVLLTDHPILLNAAKKYYKNFLVPTNFIPAKKIARSYTAAEQAALDTANSVNKIGEIVNLSQQLNSLFWHRLHAGEKIDDLQELYCDIAKLDVLSSLEIDKAKKEFPVDSSSVINCLKQKYRQTDAEGKTTLPVFLRTIAELKGYGGIQNKNYRYYETAMDYLQKVFDRFRLPPETSPLLPFSALLHPQNYDSKKVKYQQIRDILNIVRKLKKRISAVWQSNDSELDGATKSALITQFKEECLQNIHTKVLNSSTAYRLLCEIESPQNSDISQTLFYMLFSSANPIFYELIEYAKEPLAYLEPDDSGEIHLMGFRYRKQKPSENLQKTGSTGRNNSIVLP